MATLLKPRLCARQVELAVAEHFRWRQNLVVPNVSWGLPGLHYEADLVVVYPSRWAIEVEVKVTRADIKADRNKRKWDSQHFECISRNLFKEFWIAVPLGLETCDAIPDFAGVLTVDPRPDMMRWARLVRRPQRNKAARPLTPQQYQALQRLAYFRVWTMKQHLETGLRRKEHNEH
jgi:hypothetical protein